MRLPSFGLIFGSIFIVYISYSIWSLAQLFSPIKCSQKPCFRSYLAKRPPLQLALFTSPTTNPINSEVKQIYRLQKFNIDVELERNIQIEIPRKTRNNGTLFLHVVLASDNGPLDWKQLQRDGPTVIQRISLTDFAVPKANTFNLLGDNKQSKNYDQSIRPISHFKRQIFINILTDNSTMSASDIPPELARLIRVSRTNEYLPIVQNDFLETRLSELEEITKNSTKMELKFHYKPIGIGKLRLLLHVEHAFHSLKQLGFSKKDVDEVKGIFSNTNVYFLCGTIFVGAIHFLFDFLSFKNDVSFWKRKKNFAGLSTRSTLWRGFSQFVIFLYLLDENTSMLVLIPAGIGSIIEIWKCKKILKIEVSGFSLKIRTETNESESVQRAEKLTREVDKEAMQYLSYILYPLCLCGAIYSLIYQPHKSWYSWTLNSIVNGVYAFGFLFMLPQLFMNYKLKSVAALPWRAFMYKAFNTFIDDIFAFIITMPIAHRIACFRDDIVFIIYLYQRWLYPVDNSRLDDGTNSIIELVDDDQTISDETKLLKENNPVSDGDKKKTN